MDRRDRTSSTRAPGITLIAGPVLSVAVMSHHPVAQASGAAERLSELARMATFSGLVHGLLIALSLLVLWGLLSFADALGWQLQAVRLAAIAYAAGTVCMLGAATVSGFVVPRLAAHFVDVPAPDLGGALAALRLCFEINQSLAAIGTVALSAGIALWSWTLVGGAAGSAGSRGLGALGLLVGLLPAGALISGALRLDVSGMLAVIVAQAVWTIGAGVCLLRQTGGAGGPSNGGR